MKLKNCSSKPCIQNNFIQKTELVDNRFTNLYILLYSHNKGFFILSKLKIQKIWFFPLELNTNLWNGGKFGNNFKKERNN